MTELLVVANETLGGRRLHDVLAQKAKTNPSLLIRLVIPQSRPRRGSVIYLQSVRDVAQVRLELALEMLRDAGLYVAGLIGDPDPFTATMNALQFFRISRVVISTLPETRSGWLRAELIGRVRRYAACPVEHIVASSSDAVTAN